MNINNKFLTLKNKIENLQKEETSRVVEIQKLPLSLDNLKAGLEFIINIINSATLAHEEITPESILENLNIYSNSILLVETTNIHNLTTGTNYHSAFQQISSTVKQLENLVNEKIEAFLEVRQEWEEERKTFKKERDALISQLNLIEKQVRELEKNNQKQVKIINDLAEEKSASSVVKPLSLVATKNEELKDKDIESLATQLAHAEREKENLTLFNKALDGKNHHLKIALKNKEEEIKGRITFATQFRDKLRDKDYSIYSLTEQKNKLFAEVEQLQAELKATQKELEINRQSVLKIETENEKGQIITRFITVADYYQLEEENLTLQHNYEKLERMKKRRSTSSLSSSSGSPAGKLLSEELRSEPNSYFPARWENSQPTSPQLDNSTRLSELEKINEELNEEIRELHQQLNSFREENVPAPVITHKVKGKEKVENCSACVLNLAVAENRQKALAENERTIQELIRELEGFHQQRGEWWKIIKKWENEQAENKQLNSVIKKLGEEKKKIISDYQVVSEELTSALENTEAEAEILRKTVGELSEKIRQSEAEKKEISKNLNFLQTSHSQVSKNQTINITNGLAMYQFINELGIFDWWRRDDKQKKEEERRMKEILDWAEANGSKEHATVIKEAWRNIEEERKKFAMEEERLLKAWGDCKKELENLNKAFQERGKKISDLQEENEKLKSQLAKAKHDIGELEQTTADLKSENERQEREINHLKTKNGELATSQAAATATTTTINDLNNQIEKITEDNRLLNERKQAESKKVDQAKKEAEDEINQKNSKIAELEAKVKWITEKRDSNFGDWWREQNRANKLEKSLEEEKKLRQDQATELVGKRVELEKFKQELGDWQDISGGLAEELEALRTTKDDELAIRELKIKSDAELLGASEAAIIEAEKKWESLNTNYIKLERERDEIQERLIKAENQLSELKLTNQDLTSDKQASVAKIEELTSQIAILTAELGTNEERNEEAREQIDKLNNNLTTEKENAQKLAKQIQQLTEQRNIFQHRYQGQRDQLTITEQELATITKNHANCPTPTEIEQAQKDLQQIQQQLIQEQTTHTQTIQKLRQAEAENSDYEEQNIYFQEQAEVLNSNLTNEKSAKEKHLKNYRIALLRLATQKRKAKKQSQQDHDNYQQLIKGYQTDIQKLDQDKNNLQDWKDNHVCSAPSHTCQGCHETTHTNFDTYENYLSNILKVTDLSNLPLPPTDLTTLINFYLNPPTHTCPPCSLPHLPEPHVCPLNQINCSHTDYEQIKTERDDLNAKLNQSQQDYQKLQKELNQQEQEIINLRELLKQPPTIISKDNEEWTAIKTQFLANWEKLFRPALLHAYQKKIQQTTNYQQIIQLEKQLIQEELNQRESINYNLVKEKERLINWWWGLIVLLAMNALIIVGLLIKRKGKKTKKLIIKNKE